VYKDPGEDFTEVATEGKLMNSRNDKYGKYLCSEMYYSYPILVFSLKQADEYY
jgi:hypothetical protein